MKPLICNFTQSAPAQKDAEVPGWVAMHFDRELDIHTSNILAVEWFRAIGLQRDYTSEEVQLQYEGRNIDITHNAMADDFWKQPGTCLWDQALQIILTFRAKASKARRQS